MTGADAPALHGDLSARVVVDTRALEWSASPSPSVFRKRLHRVGPPEAGQVTSIVRYDPGARFPAHDHPEGEEILVLEGVFSDEHGDWPAGTYLLNPEGFRHAPFSEPGCLLFVKLRQAPGSDREHVAIQTRAPDAAWEKGDAPGLLRLPLHAPTSHPDATRLERWSAGVLPDPAERRYPSGVELLVLEGELEDEQGRYAAGSWLRLPPGARHRPRSAAGCLLYVKVGGVASLRGG
ncbi:MAG: cupin domain-containing protein [Spirochaetaceae bacterium]|nr:cupin domain-containing protein [Myxococcales bacterium]MCB9725195.1 cupin domain-containing protein [Spirochaetaceae bacterium]HPG24516.1 cupin domain-containing protein [Myxococcota bacterium]